MATDFGKKLLAKIKAILYVIGVDLGTGFTKYSLANVGIIGVMPTYCVKLTKSQWDVYLSSNGFTDEAITIYRDGYWDYYLVGTTAQAYLSNNGMSLDNLDFIGVNRYVQDFMQPIVLMIMAKLNHDLSLAGDIPLLEASVSLTTLFPPKDVDFNPAQMQRDLFRKPLTFKTKFGDVRGFRPLLHNAIPESMGGISRMMLTVNGKISKDFPATWKEDGQPARKTNHRGFDLGYRTTEYVVAEGTSLIPTSSGSITRYTMYDAHRDIEKALKIANPELRAINDISPIDLDNAIRTGKLVGAKHTIDCTDAAGIVKRKILDSFEYAINESGGIWRADVIWVSGGTSNVVRSELPGLYPNKKVYFTGSPESIQYSTVLGAVKGQWQFLMLEGVINDRMVEDSEATMQYIFDQQY